MLNRPERSNLGGFNLLWTGTGEGTLGVSMRSLVVLVPPQHTDMHHEPTLDCFKNGSPCLRAAQAVPPYRQRAAGDDERAEPAGEPRLRRHPVRRGGPGSWGPAIRTRSVFLARCIALHILKFHRLSFFVASCQMQSFFFWFRDLGDGWVDPPPTPRGVGGRAEWVIHP